MSADTTVSNHIIYMTHLKWILPAVNWYLLVSNFWNLKLPPLRASLHYSESQGRCIMIALSWSQLLVCTDTLLPTPMGINNLRVCYCFGQIKSERKTERKDRQSDWVSEERVSEWVSDIQVQRAREKNREKQKDKKMNTETDIEKKWER